MPSVAGFASPAFDGDVGEVAPPVVPVEDRAHAVADEEILEAVAVEVEDGDAGTGPDVGDQGGS